MSQGHEVTWSGQNQSTGSKDCFSGNLAPFYHLFTIPHQHTSSAAAKAFCFLSTRILPSLPIPSMCSSWFTPRLSSQHVPAHTRAQHLPQPPCTGCTWRLTHRTPSPPSFRGYDHTETCTQGLHGVVASPQTAGRSTDTKG